MRFTRVEFWAFLVAAAIISGWVAYSRSVMESLPATDWFAVRNISVPDFVQGDDPAVVYDRVIRKPFSGTWNVEVHGVTDSTNYPICSGSGTNLYELDETLPEGGVTLSWMIGKVCNLQEGQYNLEVNYEIRPDGYPPKQYSATSNIFRVLPRGAQLYIEPEQVQQLEKAQELLNNPKIIEQLQ